MSDRKVCLCVIFNHPFTQNIPLLRAIYAGRFDAVRFIVPLRHADDADVITVYRGSFAHNAYLVDAREHLKSIACSHYLCVHDDILLSPHMNQHNALEMLGVSGAAEAFMPTVQASPPDVGDWGFWATGLWRLLHPRNVLAGTGVDNFDTVKRELPPAAVAAAKLARFGAEPTTRIALTKRSLRPGSDLSGIPGFGDRRTGEQNAAFLRNTMEMLFDAPSGEGALEIDYPFVISGPSADFALVPRATLDAFCHYSGVLAAAGLWVEIAYPTALVLANEAVRTARDGDLEFIWSGPVIDPDGTLDRMEHDRTLIAGHPIKLSMVADQAAYVRRVRRMAGLATGGEAPAAAGREPVAAEQRAVVLESVLEAVLASIKPRALDRRRFQEAIRRAAHATPSEGPEAARHTLLLEQARRVLGIPPPGA